MTPTRRNICELLAVQALHSVEEHVGRLWAVFPPARVITGLISQDRRVGFYRHQCRAAGVWGLVFSLADSAALGRRRWFHRALGGDRNHKRHWTRGVVVPPKDVYTGRNYCSRPVRARDFVELAVRNNVVCRTDLESLTIGHVAGESITLRAAGRAYGPQGFRRDSLGMSLQVQSEPA